MDTAAEPCVNQNVSEGTGMQETSNVPLTTVANYSVSLLNQVLLKEAESSPSRRLSLRAGPSTEVNQLPPRLGRYTCTWDWIHDIKEIL